MVCDSTHAVQVSSKGRAIEKGDPSRSRLSFSVKIFDLSASAPGARSEAYVLVRRSDE